jgi:hypothetical protein
MRVVTDNGKLVERKYELADKYKPGADLTHLGAETLRRLVLQTHQKYTDELADHRRAIREIQAELDGCMSDNRMLEHDLNTFLPTPDDNSPNKSDLESDGA